LTGGKTVKKRKSLVMGVLCVALVTGMLPKQNGSFVRASSDITGTEGTENGASVDGASGTGQQYSEDGSTGEMLSGNTADVSFSGVSISGGKAGGKTTISFTVSGGKNSKKHYEVEKIERVYPVLDDNFPFVMNDEAYRVTAGSGNTLSCSYTFKAKDNLDTAYYMTSFAVVYSRKATDGKTTAYDSEYTVNKSFNVKITAKPVATPKPEKKEETARDDDISLKMMNTPSGTYGGSCSVGFRAYSSKYQIKSVVPVIDSSFPFVSTSEAYKVVRSAGTKNLTCHYQFQVKNNVTTGYQGVVFRISYVKNGQTLTTDKTVNVELTGKKAQTTKKETSQKKSTPRVMVTGYTTNVKNVHPNSKFLLTLQVKNNASVTVHNVKFTLSTANGEFLPVSGASTAYVDSIGAKATVNLPFRMKASAGLGSKSYAITVKAEYEDGKAESYSAEDNVSIPVVQKDKISLTEVTPPDTLSVDGTADLSFSINNLGGGTLGNVTVSCKGEDFTCEEALVGSIAAGSTGYANVTLTGTKVTSEDSDGECTIVIKYENASGDTKRYTEKTNIFVTEEDDEAWDESMGEDTEVSDKQGMPLAAKIVTGIVAVLVVIGVIRFIRRKRRLKKEELLDDELL
jgi:hypothetical protein